MKKYENPMLQVIGINTKDIIATSSLSKGESWQSGEAVLDAGRRFDDFDAGY